MGELIDLSDIREQMLNDEVESLRARLNRILEANPVENSGYWLSLEQIAQMESEWQKERKEKNWMNQSYKNWEDGN